MPVSEKSPWEVIVRPPKREKSRDQRALWHAIIGEMAAHMGHTPAEVKFIIKSEYYGTTVVTLPGGQKYAVVQSSEDEDRQGYTRLIDYTMQFAAENGIPIQDRRQPENRRT